MFRLIAEKGGRENGFKSGFDAFCCSVIGPVLRYSVGGDTPVAHHAVNSGRLKDDVTSNMRSRDGEINGGGDFARQPQTFMFSMSPVRYIRLQVDLLRIFDLSPYPPVKPCLQQG